MSGHLDDAIAAARLTEAGVTLIRGTAQVTKPGTIEVEEMATLGRPAHTKDALLARAIEDGLILPGEVATYTTFASRPRPALS